MPDDVSVSQWHRQYPEQRIESLLKDDYNGSQPYLSLQQQKELEQHLMENIFVSAKEVCHYVKERYGVKYTFKGTTNLLHRMKFVYKKPKYFTGKADRETQNKFIRKYQELEKKKNTKDKIYTKATQVLENQAAMEQLKIIQPTFVYFRIFNYLWYILWMIHVPCITSLLGYSWIKKENEWYYGCKLVSEYLQQNKQIKIILLPPHSPI